MERIASFSVDHNTIEKGMYISRIDGDIVTYDIRMKLPNGGDYLDYDAVHTFEHLFATYARNTKYSQNVIYVGPMGCRTGFYFLVQFFVILSPSFFHFFFVYICLTMCIICTNISLIVFFKFCLHTF